MTDTPAASAKTPQMGSTHDGNAEAPSTAVVCAMLPACFCALFCCLSLYNFTGTVSHGPFVGVVVGAGVVVTVSTGVVVTVVVMGLVVGSQGPGTNLVVVVTTGVVVKVPAGVVVTVVVATVVVVGGAVGAFVSHGLVAAGCKPR